MPSRVAAICALAVLILGITLTAKYMQRLRSDIDQVKNDSHRWQRSYEEQRQEAELSEKEHQEKEQELTEQIRNLQAKLDSGQERGGATAAQSGLGLQPGGNGLFFVLNSVTRGEGSDNGTVNEIALPRAPTIFMISIGLEEEVKYADYRITIFDKLERPVLTRQGYKPDRLDHLSLLFNSDFFRPGNYSLRVEGVIKKGEKNIIGDYHMRVIKRD